LVLVDHRKFKKFKAAELGEKVVIDTRGIIK
jgi:UDP-N-acetyl-D-mannosaminuronic acid dehydrogenase